MILLNVMTRSPNDLSETIPISNVKILSKRLAIKGIRKAASPGRADAACGLLREIAADAGAVDEDCFSCGGRPLYWFG